MRDYNQGGGRGNYNDRSDRPMYDAVCSNCGDSCQVPFRPSGNKPVLCDKCFSQQRGGRDNRGPSRGGFNSRPQRSGPDNRAQLDAMDRKLDAILDALSSMGSQPSQPKKTAKKSKKAAVAVAPESLVEEPTSVADLVSDTPAPEAD